MYVDEIVETSVGSARVSLRACNTCGLKKPAEATKGWIQVGIDYRTRDRTAADMFYHVRASIDFCTVDCLERFTGWRDAAGVQA